tara:strand:+ start:23155 stop:23991 length:837 start_codon:yes stop_codon:yes gene_type:complete
MIIKKERPIILVGNYGSGKTTKAIEMMGNRPYKIVYGNDIDIDDIHSYPKHHGLIIEEVHFKPDKVKILDIMNVKSEYLILTSLNEKDVPKAIINRCRKNRLGRIDRRQTELKRLSPGINIITSIDKSIYDLTIDYLNNPDRDEVIKLMKHNKPPDIQILTWVMGNVDIKKISFVDSIMRRWSTDYFYELLALSESGHSRSRPKFGKRRTFSPVPKICSKLNLKTKESYLVKPFLQNEEYRDWATKQLDSDECKILNLKKNKKKISVRKHNKKLEEFI